MHVDNLLTQSDKGNKNTVCITNNNKIDSSVSNKSFGIFYSNITSLSVHAQEYLFSLPREVDCLMLAELHKEPDYVKNKFRINNWSTSYSPPEPTQGGTHGGELVATRSHISHSNISNDIINSMTDQFGPIRFSCKIIKFHKVDVLLVSVYLWCSEGFSVRNNLILHQINIIRNMLKIPMLCIGDFNIPYEEFAESGWINRLQVKMLHPGVTTTLKTTSNRIIDFGLASIDLYNAILSIKPIYNVVWGPHIALYIIMNAKPRSIKANVQCIPRTLPLAVFHKHWKLLDDNQKQTKFQAAQSRAKQVLYKQKLKTGVAILGKPCKELSNDSKFQGELLQQQISNGEHLALSALTSELLVLDIAQIPRDEQKSYTGRSQYPIFTVKPLIKHNTSNDFCPDLLYWGQVKQLFVHMKALSLHANLGTKECITEAMASTLKFATDHSELLPPSLKDEAEIMHKLVLLHDDFTLTQILGSINSIHKCLINKRINSISTKWRKHVKDELSQGGGKLFQFISKMDKAFLSVSWDTHGKNVSGPTEFLDQQCKTWSKYWAPNNDTKSNSQLAHEFNIFRNEALKNKPNVKFDAHNLDNSLKSYKKETLGSDTWKPSELRKLPPIAKTKIASSVEVSINTLAIAHQNLISLNALLGKPNKSCRTVCKTPVLYRMALRDDDSVRAWEILNQQEYDKATIGSSALMAALKRNLAAELAHWLGNVFAAILNDYEKFFDTLDINKLMVNAILCEFPLDQMAFALQQHMAPRVIQADRCSSSPQVIHKSILAGCKFSVAFTRVYLQKAMKHICSKHKDANPEVFVDDTSMHNTGQSMNDVLEALVPCMNTFKKEVNKLNLRLSVKASIVTNNPKLTKLLISELKSNKLFFVKAKHARDLGITQSAGKSRPSNLVKTRFQKSSNRISKISKLAFTSRKARKLFTGSAFSVATWGHQGSAISNSKVVQLERHALACTGIKPAGRCRTLALLVAYGKLGTPRARLVRESIRAWFDLLRCATHEEIKDIRVAWAKAKEALILSSLNVNSVHGIMSNIIYILLSAKWDPRTFNVWEDEQGATWAITDFQVAPDTVASAIAQAYLDLDFQRASEHHNGKGIKQGIDIPSTLRYLRSMKDTTDVDYQFKAALETIIAGGCWSEVRINTIQPLHNTSCLRCGDPSDDDFHTFWTCPANCNLTHEFVADTQKLISEATKQIHEYPCLWLRGILPEHFTEIPAIHEPSNIFDPTFIKEGRWISRTYYGDASGGEYTSYPKIRRVGCSVVACSETGEVQFGAHFPLPGPVQSVGRGELYALYALVQFLEPLAEVQFVTDNLNVKRTYNKGPRAAANSSNCDIYKLIFDIIYDKGLRVGVRWMPSHLGLGIDDPRPEGVSHLDVLSNDRADHYAAEAAGNVQLPKSITSPHIHHIKLTKYIQRRLATILISLPARDREKCDKPEPTPRIKLCDLIISTSHKIVHKDNRLFCSECMSNFSTTDPSCKLWLQTKCSSFNKSSTLASQTFQPFRIHDTIHRGKSVSHSSHELMNYRGLIYCNKCGARAGENQFRYLARQCEPPGNTGTLLLSRINSGQLPYGFSNWPETT